MLSAASRLEEALEETVIIVSVLRYLVFWAGPTLENRPCSFI